MIPLGDLAALLPYSDQLVYAFVALLARLSGLLLLLPGLGMRIIPVRVKVSVAIALTALCLPSYGFHYANVADQFMPVLIREVIVGSFFGLAARTFIFALSFTGAVVAQSLSLSQIFGAGAFEEANTTISTLLTTGGATLFLTMGLHLAAIEIVLGSVTRFPPDGVGWPGSLGGFAEVLVTLSGQALALATVLSAPFLLMNLAYYILLGVLNRAMPQLMVTFVGLPAITLSGILLLMIVISPLMTKWADGTIAGLGAVVP